MTNLGNSAKVATRDMKRIADEELRKMGIVAKDIDQPIGTLSGGRAGAWPSPGRSTSGPGC